MGRSARVAGWQRWVAGVTMGEAAQGGGSGENELTCGVDARLFGGDCARGVEGEGPLRLGRLDDNRLALRPAHGKKNNRVIWTEA